MSQESRCMPVEGNGYCNMMKIGSRVGKVGYPGRAALSCVTSNFGRS